MTRAMAAATIALALAGCAPERIVPELRAVPCPPNPPAVACPDFPARPATLRDLLSAWADARAAHATCRAALRAWRETHETCLQDSE